MPLLSTEKQQILILVAQAAVAEMELQKMLQGSDVRAQAQAYLGVIKAEQELIDYLNSIEE